MRTSPVHYIAPSSISVVPNANGSQRDLAVYVAQGTKIRVLCPKAGIGIDDSTYQEWTITGRNRRLDDIEGVKEYTIYARLAKTDKKNGYLVFCPKTQYGDAYKYLSLDTDDGLAPVSPSSEHTVSEEYWFVRLGDISLPENGLRTITLDTGILGTDGFNTEWALNPDALPLRIELNSTVNDEDTGLNPYVYWEQSLVLTSTLVEGWSGTDITRFDHWEISRNSGDSDADANWLTSVRKDAFSESGEITLSHSRDNDDFNGAVAATFTVMAMERNPEYVEGSATIPPFLVLRTATITVHAETVERYELALATAIVSYNPQTGSYSPAGGVEVRIRAVNQRGDVYELTNRQYTDADLRGYYAPVGSAFPLSPNLIFSGSDDDIAAAVIPIIAFSSQQSINIRLANAEDTELMLETIAFVRDGEDSKEREWIYRKNSQEGYSGTTGTANGQPVSGKTGDIYNCYLVDDFVPNNWTDDPSGVTSAGDIEYTAYRDYDKALRRWGAFQQPVIWTRYGVNGTDGTIIQRMYISNNSSVWSGTLPTDYVDDPSGWRTVPTSVSSSARYRWLTERISNDGGSTWGSGWSSPQIDTYLAEDGTSISIKGSAYGVIEWGEVLPREGAEGERWLMNNGDTDNMEVYYIDDWTLLTGHWEGEAAEIGDCYIVGTHLYICEREYASGFEAPAWKDLGQIKGEDGIDGTSPYFADIENEMDSIPCDDEGYTTSDYDKYIGVNLWHGSTPIAISSLTTTSASGITITPDAHNKRIRVQVQRGVQIAEVNNITISLAGPGSGSHILHFVLNGVRSGVPGQSATVFSLLPSVSAIKRDKNGTLTPASPMTCDVLKKVGNADAVRATSSDGTLRYRVDGDITNFQEGTAIDINSGSVAYTASNKFITFAFFVGTTLVDKERVSIVYDGEDGDNAPYNVYTYARYDSRAGDATTGAPTGNIDTSVGDSGWASQAPSPVSSYPYIWQRMQHYTSTGSMDATSYVCLTGAPGADGGRGRTGRFYYYAGEYSSAAIYRIEATQAPYVKYNDSFWMLDYKGEELPYEPWPSDGKPGAPSSATDNPWTQMTSDQQYYIARAFFGEYAHLGSFVISGDWMISQYGTYKPDANTTIVVNGDNILTYPTAYTHFKAADPLAEGTAGYPCFAPNFAVDGLTGETYQQNAYLQGEVHATSGVFQNVKVSGGIRSPFTYVEQTFNNDLSDNIAIYSISSFDSVYTIPWDASQSGRRILVANYKWRNNEQSSAGYVRINAPDGKYFFEDGKTKPAIRMSREIVELVGYGDSSNFYGWIVLSRTDLGTERSYGHNVKALAMGVMTWTGSEMTGYTSTFDGSELTCTRIDTGKYNVTFGNTGWFGRDDDVLVVVTGYGSATSIFQTRTPIYANLNSKSTTGFEVWTGDNSSLNDGGFTFLVMNANDWSSLRIPR